MEEILEKRERLLNLQDELRSQRELFIQDLLVRIFNPEIKTREALKKYFHLWEITGEYYNNASLLVNDALVELDENTLSDELQKELITCLEELSFLMPHQVYSLEYLDEAKRVELNHLDMSELDRETFGMCHEYLEEEYDKQIGEAFPIIVKIKRINDQKKIKKQGGNNEQN